MGRTRLYGVTMVGEVARPVEWAAVGAAAAREMGGRGGFGERAGCEHMHRLLRVGREGRGHGHEKAGFEMLKAQRVADFCGRFFGRVL